MENLLIKSGFLINKNLFFNRFLGWLFINIIIAFMINNILNLAFDIPFALKLFTNVNFLSIIPISIFALRSGAESPTEVFLPINNKFVKEFLFTLS